MNEIDKAGGDSEMAKEAIRALMEKDEELLLYVALHGAKVIEAIHEAPNATIH
jgi:hypothetical protein